MCGIAGSNHRGKAFKLYQSNLDRGFYSSGSMTIGGWGVDYIDIQKIKGSFGLPEPEFPEYTSSIQYALYHSRGPTVETKEFVPDNNHPFVYGDWIVSHNGIISNFNELCKEYFPSEDFTGKTDSCIIPRILSIKMTPDLALEKLEGTFAVWMYNTSYRKLFIARSSSTLFANFSTGDFASTYFEGSVSLREGFIYEVRDFSNIVEIVSFKTRSPYFIL